MATLNLIPNPLVLGAQVGVFLASYVAVKKLYVEPYLAVRDKRQALTVGSKDEATKALAESDAISKRLESRYIAAAASAKVEREKIRDAAQSERDRQLSAAEKDARAQIAAVEEQIRAELAVEKGKIPGIVQALTEDVYRLALA